MAHYRNNANEKSLQTSVMVDTLILWFNVMQWAVVNVTAPGSEWWMRQTKHLNLMGPLFLSHVKVKRQH